MIGAIAQSDAIVAVSEEMSGYLRQYLPENKPVQVMHNCIDLGSWSSLEKTSSSNNDAQLLFVGTIEASKGVFDLVQAFARSNCSRARLAIVGSDNGTGDLNRLQALVRTLDLTECCQFLGLVYGKQKNQIFADSDIYLLPSYAEGQPIAILEAMAAGLPIIASRVGAVPDVVKDGENGILVEPGDIQALAQAIDRLVHDASLCKRMAQKSRQLAYRYDVQPYVRRLLYLYESVAENA